MRLKNTTNFPDCMLRRMVSWCCKELGLPVRRVMSAEFRQRRVQRFSGLAYRRRIIVSVAPDSFFPWTDNGISPGLIRSGIVRTLADRTECLVNITAHELRHLVAYVDVERTRRRTTPGSSERYTERDAQVVLNAFRANREALLTEWNVTPIREAKPKPTRQQQNEAKAREALARWERKAKLAKTKVAAYRKLVRYYDRVAAHQSSTQT